MDGERSWRPLLSSAANEGRPALSPDGAWIAYASDETGQGEVYVERHPDLWNKEQISTDGGRVSAWSLDGSDLFYHDLSGLRMMVVATSTDPTLTLGAPTVAFEGPYYVPPFNRQYDLSPNGRFLMIKPSGAATGDSASAPRQIVVVEKLFEELRRLVPLP